MRGVPGTAGSNRCHQTAGRLPSLSASRWVKMSAAAGTDRSLPDLHPGKAAQHRDRAGSSAVYVSRFVTI